MLTGEVRVQIDAIWLAAESKLPGVKVSGTWRFWRVDIEDWIKRQASPSKDRKI